MKKTLRIALIVVLVVVAIPVLLCAGISAYASIDTWYYKNFEKPYFLNNQFDTTWETEDGIFSLCVLSPEKRDGDGEEPIIGTYTHENGTLEIAMFVHVGGKVGSWHEYGVYAEEMYEYMVEVEKMDVPYKPYGDEGSLANVIIEYESKDEIVITVTKAFRDIFEEGDAFRFYRVDNTPQTE